MKLGQITVPYKLGLQGEDTPRALKKKRPLTQAEKTIEPLPTLTRGDITRVSMGRDLHFVLWRGG